MTELKKYDLVRYVPGHVFGDESHKDCELGIVSEIRIGVAIVFVRFEKQIRKLGFDGAVGQACGPDSLVFVERGWDTDAERKELLGNRRQLVSIPTDRASLVLSWIGMVHIRLSSFEAEAISSRGC